MSKQEEISPFALQREFGQLRRLYGEYHAARKDRSVVHYDPADPTTQQILELEAKLRDFYKIPFVLIKGGWDPVDSEEALAKEKYQSARAGIMSMQNMSLNESARYLQRGLYSKIAGKVFKVGVRFAIVLSGPNQPVKVIRGEEGMTHQDIRVRVPGVGDLTSRPDASGFLVESGKRAYLVLENPDMVWTSSLDLVPLMGMHTVSAPFYSVNDLDSESGNARLVGPDFEPLITQAIDYMEQRKKAKP